MHKNISGTNGGAPPAPTALAAFLGALSFAYIGTADQGAAPANREKAATSPTESIGAVGLIARRVSHIDPATRIGMESGWLAANADISLATSEGVVQLHCNWPYCQGEGTAALEFYLSYRSAKVLAAFADPNILRLEPAMAGVVVLLTDGSSAAADFELYDGYQLGSIDCFGHVVIGKTETQPMIEFIDKVNSNDIDESAWRVMEMQDRMRSLRSRGSIDAHGRRQGLWTILDPRGETVLEFTWRDGIPDGAYRFRDLWGEGIGSIRRGFRTGMRIEWRKEQRITTEFFADMMHGERVTYGLDGLVFNRSAYDCNLPVAERPEGVTTRMAHMKSYLESLEELETRRKQ